MWSSLAYPSESANPLPEHQGRPQALSAVRQSPGASLVLLGGTGIGKLTLPLAKSHVTSIKTSEKAERPTV